MLGIRRDPYSKQIQMNQQATGRPLYGAGRGQAATTGPVEKDGYLDREARKKKRRLELQRRLRVNSQTQGGASLSGSLYQGR